MIHGKNASKSAQFSHFTVTPTQLQKMSESDFEVCFAAVPSTPLPYDDSYTVSGLTAQSGLTKNRKSAMRMIKQGGVQMNGESVTSDIKITREMCLFNKYIVLRAGKKHFSLI